MTVVDASERLRSLLSALDGAIRVPRVPTGRGGESVGGADAQRIATAEIDELLRRVSALTGVLGRRPDSQWDDVDQLSARLLMADLSLVAGVTRALNTQAAARLAAAREGLAAARRDLGPTVKGAAP